MTKKTKKSKTPSKKSKKSKTPAKKKKVAKSKTVKKKIKIKKNSIESISKLDEDKFKQGLPQVKTLPLPTLALSMEFDSIPN